MRKASIRSAIMARITLEAVIQRRFYVFTHPKAIAGVELRLRDLLRGEAPHGPLQPA